MDIQAYKWNNTNFENNGDRTLSPTNCILKVQLNGICEVELDHPYDKEKSWTYLESEDVVAVPTPWSEKQLFRIYDREKTITGLKVYARHIYFDAVKYNIDSNLHIKNKNGKQALKLILRNTPFIAHSNIVDINDCYFFKNNVIEGIAGNKDNCFLTRWGGELFLDNYNVYINSRVGGNKGLRISYGYNLENLSLKRNTEGVFTRLQPYVIKNTTDTIELPEKYVDSKYINNYPSIYEKYINLSEFMHLKDGEDDTENAYETLEELHKAMRNKCRELFENGLDTPKTNGTVNMVILENTTEYKHVKDLVHVNLGDDILVEHYDIGVESETRCVGYTWNCITKKYLNIELGELEKDFFDFQNSTTHNLDDILNKDGTVNANKLQGIINSLNTKFRAMRDIAQKQHVMAILFEDRVEESPTYGAAAFGTKGLMIAKERLPDDSDWDWRTFIEAGLVYADELVGILKTVLIKSMDGSFELDLKNSGGAIFRNNGKIAMEIANNAVKLFNYLKDGDYIGGLVSLINKDDPNKPLVGLVNDYDSAISIGYELKDSKTVPSYVEFDIYGILGRKYPITFFEETEFIKAIHVSTAHLLTAIFGEHEIYNSVYNNLIMKIKNGQRLKVNFNDSNANISFGEDSFSILDFFKQSGSNDCWCGYNFFVDRNLHSNGDISCGGQKHRIVDTEHYGKVKMNAMESTECWFYDYGDGEIINGEAVIKINPIFLETVNTNIPYKVRVWSEDGTKVYCKRAKRFKQYFIVEGDEDGYFEYEIIGKQRGYETARMEEYIKEKSSALRTRNIKVNAAIKPKERRDN